MLRRCTASLLAGAALCALYSSSGPRREFQPVALVPVPAGVALTSPIYGPATAYEFPADLRAPEPEMAVPKKRTSKMKTRSRKANWYAKAKRQSELAWNRAMSAKVDLNDPFGDKKGDDEDDDDEEEEE